MHPPRPSTANLLLPEMSGGEWVPSSHSLATRERARERGQQSRVFIPRAPFLKKTKTSKCIRNNKKGHSSVSLGRPLLGSLIYRLGPCGPHPLLPLEPPVWRWWCCCCSVPIRLFIGHHLTSSAGLGIKTFTHAKNENQRCNSSGDVLVWVVGRVLCHPCHWLSMFESLAL